jgi:G2/mitotic-specific cyclin 2
LPCYQMLLEKLVEEDFPAQYVYKKYAHKKFMKASLFAVEWALAEFEDNSDSPACEMMSEG